LHPPTKSPGRSVTQRNWDRNSPLFTHRTAILKGRLPVTVRKEEKKKEEKKREREIPTFYI